MSETARLPRTFLEWILLFGPGAIIASLTIGTGELIFSTRGGALFGYHILFVFALTSLLKWTLVISTSRHMVLTGVHPYERMMSLPGPRGWLVVLLLMIATVAMPIWVSFHSGVLGNLMAWMTDTRTLFHGGIDYAWAAVILLAVMFLSLTGGYSVLEKTQTAVVLTMVLCAGITLVLYNPDWVELLTGLLPHSLHYPEWLAEHHPEIARHSVWVETTRYIGVIGGAGFDYLCYTSWLREKRWGVLPGRASSEQLAEIAADPHHPVRKWVNAPIVDCAISFLLVVIFSAVFVASGAIFLGPAHTIPNEDNLLNLQAQFVTTIHPWLLPLYVLGALLTMLGTLYGTVEVACTIGDEIVRSFFSKWTPTHASRLRRGIMLWCTVIALMIHGWLFLRQSHASSPSGENGVASASGSTEVAPLKKPKVLLQIMTPVNLFTGVLSCGVICVLTLWMDRRWLPATLQPPLAIVVLNAIGGLLFLIIGVKGVWENEDRILVGRVSAVLFVLSLIIAWLIQRSATLPKSETVDTPTDISA